MRQEIVNLRTGVVIASNAILANNPWRRMKGLLGRRSLPAGEAIVLSPASSIHTVFMLFSIDVVYLDRENTVLKVVTSLAPFRFSAARTAHTVIEMPGGWLAGFDVRNGDKLELEIIVEGKP